MFRNWYISQQQGETAADAFASPNEEGALEGLSPPGDSTSAAAQRSLCTYTRSELERECTLMQLQLSQLHHALEQIQAQHLVRHSLFFSSFGPLCSLEACSGQRCLIFRSYKLSTPTNPSILSWPNSDFDFLTITSFSHFSLALYF